MAAAPTARTPADSPQTPLMSITRQMAQMGLTPDDMISSILVDHEQAKSVSPPPFRGRPSPSPPSVATKSKGYSQQELPPQLQTPIGGFSPRVRSESERESTLRRAHWKPIEKAAKCADPSCRKRFTWKDRRRNCCMCGEVFCRQCTKFRRKLSNNAEPDPLGISYQVCKACFHKTEQVGTDRDLKKEFGWYRNVMLSARKKKEEREQAKPLPARQRSETKRTAIKDEADRLTEGFQANPGWFRGLVSEMKVPKWQKSDKWTKSGDASHCFNCKTQFKLAVLNRKVHCRICGQVFCTTCTKDEILLYVDIEDKAAKWAVNNRSGGPTTNPERYETLPICSDCSNELCSILVDDLSLPAPQLCDFLERLAALQEKLSTLKTKIETWLPTYQRIVDSFDIDDCSPRSVEGRSPMRNLVKVQSDLSDAFSQLAVQSQKLKQLQPRTVPQEKLLKHVMIGMYRFYSENMFLFRASKNRLGEFTPVDHMVEIQAIVSQQSIERIHVLVQQIVYEALQLLTQYRFDNSFLQCITDIDGAIDDEYKPFLVKQGENWEEYRGKVRVFIKDEMKTNRRIKIARSIPRRAPKTAMYVQYIVAQQSSSILHECHRELQAKTTDIEFPLTKSCMEKACTQLDALLTGLINHT